MNNGLDNNGITTLNFGEMSTGITTSVLTNLVETVASKVYQKAKGVVVNSVKKHEVDIGTAFREYLAYSVTQYDKIKTLLYRHTPMPIYSFYEFVDLELDEDRIDTSDINNVLAVGNKLIVSGTGGCGKSVMLKHFFLNTVRNTDYIPVLIELRGLNDYQKQDLNLEEYIYKRMKILKFKLEEEYFKYSLEAGCYVILLDGFDEVKNQLSPKVTKQILKLSKKYPDNYYIISSRPLDEFIGWSQFKELKSLPLSKRQALSLINKLDYEPNVKSKFYDELKDNLFDKYETFASNPLLLTIMLLTFEDRASIPDKVNDFYASAFSTLFHKHDATKDGYKREFLSKLGYEDFKAVFSYFCFKSFFNSDYKFSDDKILKYIGMAKRKSIADKNFKSEDYLTDLTNAVCVIVHEGLDYIFTHRSFQEYFAALYTTQLDDDTQKRFLGKWITENSRRRTSAYLDMLYELQPKRFINNIISPAIKELESLYEQNGKSNEWLIRFLYKGIDKIIPNESRSVAYFYVARNLHYLEAIKRACAIRGYCSNILIRFLSTFDNTLAHGYVGNDWYFDTVSSHISQEQKNMLVGCDFICWDDNEMHNHMQEIMSKLQPLIECYKFAVKFVNEFENQSLSDTDSFDDMLDEL